MPKAYLNRSKPTMCPGKNFQKAGHALINNGNEVCRYLMIGERNDHEVVYYKDFGRVGVRLTGEGYCASETVDTWEGEDAGQ